MAIYNVFISTLKQLYFVNSSLLLLLPGLFLDCTAKIQANGQNFQPVMIVSDRLILHSPSRLGINLGSQSYWDSAQLTRNLISRNPGFEGEIYRSLVRCSSSSTQDTCQEDSASAWKDDFWRGASYEFISGDAYGRRGTVAAYEAASNSRGGVLRFEKPGPKPAEGDTVILGKQVEGNGQAGWWTNACCGGSISTEFHDIAKESPGRQALRLSSASGGRAEIASYFDTLEDHTFVQMRGGYVLSFRAKGIGGKRLMTIDVGRATEPVGHRYLAKTFPVDSHWRQYRFPFDVEESGHDAGTAHVSFAAVESDILLDDVSLTANSRQTQNRTVFRDEVVQALRELQPGLLRYWGGQLGETLDNQLAPEFARRRAGYSAWQTDESNIGYGLHDFLQLCREVPTEPYYVIPTTFSTSEMRGLIEYLAAPASTGYGAVRARLGQIRPWVETFPKIHLEFGNEAWNPSFKGATLEDPAAYGRRASVLFDAARQASGWDDRHFDLIIGGQAVNVERNRKILESSRGFNSFAVAPYQMNEISSTKTQDELFGPMLAEPQAITSRSGYMRRNRELLPSEKQLAVYEVNASTTEGSISQADLDRLIPSLGSGLAVVENMLLTMRDLGVRSQMFWSLPQYMLRRGDGKTVKLFGAVVDMGATNRKRPVFLAMQMANDAIDGDLIETRQSGGDPTRVQPALNGVPKTVVHLIQSFAFRNGDRRSLILLNLSLSDAFAVRFDGPGSPRGETEMETLWAPSIEANNEERENVTISKARFAGFQAQHDFRLPAHSMVVLRWRQATMR